MLKNLILTSNLILKKFNLHSFSTLQTSFKINFIYTYLENKNFLIKKKNTT